MASVLENGKIAELLALTEPGSTRDPETNRNLIAAADAIAYRAAKSANERAVADRVAQRGQIRADERAVFGALLRRGAETEDERELVRRAAKIRMYLPAGEPEMPEDVDLLRRIGEAAAANSTDQIRLNKALDELVARQIAGRRAKAGDDLARMVDDMKLAEDAVRHAQAEWDHSRARIADLIQRRENARRFWRIRRTTGTA